MINNENNGYFRGLRIIVMEQGITETEAKIKNFGFKRQFFDFKCSFPQFFQLNMQNTLLTMVIFF